MSTPTLNRRPDSITMRDIAERAGVSRPTVSSVLNERSESMGIPASTRERVLEAARQLGYRRNALARAIKTGRSQTLVFWLETPTWSTPRARYPASWMKPMPTITTSNAFVFMTVPKTKPLSSDVRNSA